jgi:aerobic-type carbon monoxide dehydrogenase small subunit (CoxS/CutS family)
MVGNICRCANYNRYVESVLAAAGPSARATGAGGPR